MSMHDREWRLYVSNPAYWLAAFWQAVETAILYDQLHDLTMRLGAIAAFTRRCEEMYDEERRLRIHFEARVLELRQTLNEGMRSRPQGDVQGKGHDLRALPTACFWCGNPLVQGHKCEHRAAPVAEPMAEPMAVTLAPAKEPRSMKVFEVIYDREGTLHRVYLCAGDELSARDELRLYLMRTLHTHLLPLYHVEHITERMSIGVEYSAQD